MPSPSTIPSPNLPTQQHPTNAPKQNGLSLGATVGIAIGIALLVIFSAMGAWIFVRRRRRIWAKQRREEDAKIEAKGDGPDEEIMKKVGGLGEVRGWEKDVESGRVVEIGFCEKDFEVEGLAEMEGRCDGRRIQGKGLGELCGDERRQGITSEEDAVEIAESKVFVAELEGSRVGDDGKRDYGGVKGEKEMGAL